MLTQEKLKTHFHYNKSTGIFKWIKPITNNVKKGDVIKDTDTGGYLRVGIGGRYYPIHRLAFLYVEGYIPENEVDHINRIRTDNRWKNLREVSRQCNRRNSKVYITNKSGVSGIHFYRPSKKWCAYINANSKKINLGYFKDFDEAVAHRFAAEQCLNWKGCNSNSSAYLHMKEVICR